MKFNKLNKILAKNKECKQCGENNKSKNWVFQIKDETVEFECKKCGFRIEEK